MNVRDSIAVTGQVILLKSDPNPWNRRLLGPCDLELWQTTSNNYREPLPCSYNRCVPFDSHPWIQIIVFRLETLKSEPNRRFIGPRDFEIWRMTPKNNGAPLLSHRSPVNSTPKGPIMRTLILLWCESAFFFALLALCAGNSPVTGEFL